MLDTLLYEAQGACFAISAVLAVVLNRGEPCVLSWLKNRRGPSAALFDISVALSSPDRSCLATSVSSVGGS